METHYQKCLRARSALSKIVEDWKVYSKEKKNKVLAILFEMIEDQKSQLKDKKIQDCKTYYQILLGDEKCLI